MSGKKVAGDVLTHLAQEALKPASSFVDALLAPKLANLKRWSEERETNTELMSQRTQALMRTYLRRLLRRVSGITTIVFPQQILPLPLVYEPLVVIHKYSRNEISLAAIRTAGARTLIVDDAGMGKSTFVKHLVLTELRESERFPVLLELRRLKAEETLMDAFITEFDAFERPIAKEVIWRMAASGRFMIILDGFDEIPLSRRSALAREIEELTAKSENSTVILTSRPELALPAISGAQVVRFEALSIDQARSLIKRYDKASRLDVGARLVRELDAVPERFLETPLLVALLYRTFGYNGTISTRITTFYDELYAALYKGHDLTKAGFNREKHSALDIEQFRRLLRAVAFLLVSKQRDSLSGDSDAIAAIEEGMSLSNVMPQSAAAFLGDLLLSVPLMVRDGTEIGFVHKSLAEFFAAEFLARASNGEALVQAIEAGPLRQRFGEVFSFLAELNPLLFRATLASRLASEVVKREPVASHPVIDTLLFLAPDTQIALWHKNDAFGRELEHAVWYFYGECFEQECVLTIGFDDERLVVHRDAWAAVTEDFDAELGHVDYSFESLRDLLPLGQWLRLGQRRMLDEVAPLIVEPIATVLADVFRPSMVHEGDMPLRVLSRQKAEGVLIQVQEQAEKSRWLQEMLSSASTTKI